MNLTHRLILEAILDGRHSTRSIVTHIRNRTGLETRVVRMDMFLRQMIDAHLITCRFKGRRWDFDHTECFLKEETRDQLGSLGLDHRRPRVDHHQANQST